MGRSVPLIPPGIFFKPSSLIGRLAAKRREVPPPNWGDFSHFGDARTPGGVVQQFNSPFLGGLIFLNLKGGLIAFTWATFFVSFPLRDMGVSFGVGLFSPGKFLF